MGVVDENIFPKLILDGVTSDPAAPSSDNWKLYAKPDGIYARSSNATVGPLGAAGSVATDAIFDAKGDLAVGTGANTASKLTAGTDGYVLTARSSEATGLKWEAAGGGVEVPVYVQSKTAQSSATNPAVTLDATPANGALLILVANLTGRASSAVASTNGTWTLIRRYQSGSDRKEIWVGKVSTSGGATITVTTASNDYYSLNAMEITDPGVTPALGNYSEGTWSGNGYPFRGTGLTAGRLFVALAGPTNSSLTGYSWANVPSVSGATLTGAGLIVGFVPTGGVVEVYSSGYSSAGAGAFVVADIT